MSVLQELHDSEINAGVQSFYDGCWSAWIGDPMNGEKTRDDALSSFEECEVWLNQTAREFYPNSLYARQSSQAPIN